MPKSSLSPAPSGRCRAHSPSASFCLSGAMLRRLLLVASVLFLSAGSVRASTYTGLANVCDLQDCTGFVPGDPADFGDARNWSPKGVPGAGSSAIIGSGFTVNAINTTVGNLTLDNCTLQGTATVHASSGMALKNANVACLLTADAGCTTTITTGLTLPGGTFTNKGTVNWTSGDIATYQGTLGFAVVDNQGNFNIKCDQSLYWNPNVGGTPTPFSNTGIITKSASAGTTNISLTFNNRQYTDVQSGILHLDGGGTETGSFNTALGKSIEFNSGLYNFSSTSRIIGAGLSSVTAPITALGTITAGTSTGSTGHFVINSDLSGAVTVATLSTGTAEWRSGNLTGQLTVPSGSTLSLTTTDGKYLSGPTASLTNNGNLYWSQGPIGANTGGVDKTHTSTFTNNGTMRIYSDEAFTWNPNVGGTPTVFTNTGTMSKVSTAGVGESQFTGININSSGKIDAQVGTLDFDGVGGSLSGTSNSATNAVIIFKGGPFALSTLHVTGAGETDAYNATFNGALTAAAFNGLAAGHFAIIGDLSGTVTAGAVGGTAEWQLGNLVGKLTIPVGSTFGITTTDGKYLSGPTASLTNNGTMTWSAGPIVGYSGGADAAHTSTFVNNGTFNISGNDVFTWNPNVGGTPTVFTNAGTVHKTAGTGVSSIGDGAITVKSSGTVDAQAGTLLFNGSGGTFSGTSNSGVNGVVQLTGSYTGGTLYVTGGGTTAANNVALTGTVTAAPNAGFSAGHFAIIGDLSGTVTAGAVGGTAEWQLGNLVGKLTIPVGSTFGITTTDGKYLSGPTASLTNNGTMTWSAGPIVGYSGGADAAHTSTFVNNGTFNISGNDAFTWNPNVGGIPTILTNNGTINKLAVGTTTSFSGITFKNTKIINVTAGTLDVTDTFTQTTPTGFTLLNGGTLAGTIRINGGYLSGVGAINGSVINAAVTSVGSPVGTLSISNDYTQGSTGTMSVNLNGVTAGTQYDQLNVTGNVTLAGALTVSAGFAPASGTVFTIINNTGGSAVIGKFTGLSEGAFTNAGGKGFRISYVGGTGNDVTLTTVPSISISDVTVTEGNSGTTNANFTVALSSSSTQTVTVKYATADSTATAGSDYTAKALTTLTFAPGQTSKIVAVPIIGDTIDENNETFFVNLSSATNAIITDAQGVGTITDDDVSLTVNNPRSLLEGNPGSPGSVTFDITLSGTPTQTVTFDYATRDGINNPAIAGSDYVEKHGKWTFLPTDTGPALTKKVTISFIGDAVPELNETFFFDLLTPTNATIADSRGVGQINNDDGPGISIGNAVPINEGNAGTSSQTFVVALSAASTNTITVDWTTANLTANSTDYVAASGTLTFLPGEPLTQTITVLVKGDGTMEPNESYKVVLSKPTYAFVADGVGIGTINNDDVAALISQDEPSQ